MSELPPGTPGVASQRANRGRGKRVAFAAIGTVALVLGGAVPATASPAVSPPQFDSAEEEILASLDALPQAPGLALAELKVAGAPATIEAGAPLQLTLSVESYLLGAPTPTGSVSLLEFTSRGLETLGTQQLVNGSAEMVLRPFGLGPKGIVAVYEGDAEYLPNLQFVAPFEVTPVTTVVSVDIDSNSPAYGGAALGVWTTAQSICESQAPDPDVRDLCESTHGSPAGDITLKMDGVVVGTQPVAGSDRVGIPDWLSLEADLGASDARSVLRFDVPIPDRAFDTPEHYVFTAEFTPTNWFSAATSDEVSVETRAAETTVDLVLGDLASPVTKLLVGETVDLLAYVGVDPYWAGAVDGTVNLWLNDEILVEGLTLADDAPIATASLRFDEPGDFSLVAEFVPDSLNHIGSLSTPYTFSVAKVTPDGGKHDGNDGKPAQTVAKNDTLARTGGDAAPIAFGAAALLLAAAGATLLLARRRTVDTPR